MDDQREFAEISDRSSKNLTQSASWMESKPRIPPFNISCTPPNFSNLEIRVITKYTVSNIQKLNSEALGGGKLFGPHPSLR